MQLRFYGFVLLLTLDLLAGCQPDAGHPADAGYAYFPLEPGHYVVYDVREEAYSRQTAPVVRTYQLKEVVGAAYRDVAGQTSFLLRRYRRTTDSQPWQADSIWAARRTASEAIRTENGRDFVKLAFPLSDQLRWDSNRHNALGEDTAETRNKDQPFRVLDTAYAQTITVLVQDDSTLLARDKRLEIYARQVGLLYKERTQLVYCQSTPACIGTNQIEYGIRQQYHLRLTGQE